MKLDPFIQKPWAISKELARAFSVKKIEATLGIFNRAGATNFYVVDFYKQRLILGNSTNVEFSGYSKIIIEKEKFEFYDRILKAGETENLIKLHEKAVEIFYQYPESQRYDLEITCYLTAKTANDDEMVLQHIIVPYKLCNNGNMWLSLFTVTPVPILPLHKARIVHIKTGEVYNYINDTFVLSEFGTLTSEDIKMLELFAKDMSVKELCDLLKISESGYKLKRQRIFQKLNVKSWAAAVCKAYELRIF